jgi:hypothetical protein
VLKWRSTEVRLKAEVAERSLTQSSRVIEVCDESLSRPEIVPRAAGSPVSLGYKKLSLHVSPDSDMKF